MGNKCSIKEVLVQGNSITCKYAVEGEWKKCFSSESMKVEYSIDVSNVPKSVAVIPFLANLLPMAWVFDAEIEVKELDRAFYDSIKDFKKGYINMYPTMDLKGSLSVSDLVDSQVNGDGSIAFFSGGVDAFNTLVKHYEEKPTLVTLWGSDVKLWDSEGWEKVTTHLKETAESFGIDYVTVKSEFRTFMDDLPLNVAVKKSGDGWWHGFQHGIGIICHAAPIAYALGKKSIYFASSFTANDRGKVTCASDPTIDNFVKFCGASVYHDGYEFCRQDKIHNIVEYTRKNKTNIALRVCWQSTGGSNCCNCEKCWRTILGVYSEGENPQEFGFAYKDFGTLCKKMYKKRELFAKDKGLRYKPIQQRMNETYKLEEVDPAIKWFYGIDLEKLNTRYVWKTFWTKVRKRIKRYLKIK